MRKQLDKPKLRDILQNDWPAHPKNFNVIKDKEKNCFRLKETKEI